METNIRKFINGIINHGNARIYRKNKISGLPHTKRYDFYVDKTGDIKERVFYEKQMSFLEDGNKSLKF